MPGADGQPIRQLNQDNNRLKADNELLTDQVNRLHSALKNLIDLQKSVVGLNSETNVFKLVNEILSKTIEAVDSKNGSLMLLDNDSNELVFVEVIGAARNKLLNYRIPSNTGIVGWSVKNHKPRLVENVSVDPLFNPRIDQFTGTITKTIICVPIMNGDICLGAIEVLNTRTGRFFTQLDVDVIVLAASLSGMAISAAEKL